MKKYKRWIEAGVVFVLWIAAWWYFVAVSSYPQTADELLYMDSAWNQLPVLFIARRYFHVFFLRGFMLIAGNPIQGGWLYWGFVMSSTMVMVYYLAQYINKAFDPLRGVVAVSFLLTFNYYLPFAGIPYTDYTAMFVFILALGCYLLSIRLEGIWRNVALVALGFFIYLGFRSKETTIITVVFVAGLLFEGNTIHWKFFYYKLIWVVVGFSMAWIMMYGLDIQIMGETVSIVESYGANSSGRVTSPRNLIERTLAYLGGDYLYIIARNWGVRYMEAIPIYLILMGIALFRNWKKYNGSIRLLWSLPVMLFGLFMLGRVRDLPRHLITIVPVLSVLAVQMWPTIEALKEDNNKRWKKNSLVFVFLIFLLLGFSTKWAGSFILLRIVPLVLLAAVMCLGVWVKKWDKGIYYFVIIALFFVNAPIIWQHTKNLNKGYYAIGGKLRFEPLELMGTNFECNDRVLISQDAIKFGDYGATDIRRMFNIYFLCDYTDNEFIYIVEDDWYGQVMLGKHENIWVTHEEYKMLTMAQRLNLTSLYENHLEQVGVIFFLRK